MAWVKLKHYCEQTGETPMSVHNKRRTGVFIDNLHCRVAGDGNLWVNMDEAQKWAATSTPQQKSGDVAVQP
jgi:hypothetical protein